MGEITINPIHNVYKKYRTMNLVNPYIFTPPATYNTYIGGVSATISTAALLATKLGISVGAISNFTVVGSDIKCLITGSYTPAVLCWNANTSITHYIDTDGLVLQMPTFFGCTSMTGKVEFINATSVDMSGGGYLVANTGITEVILPKVTSVGDYAFNSSSYAKNLKVAYMPICTALGSTSGNNNVFQFNNADLKIYVHPSLATNNSGAPDGDLTGWSVGYVTNFTAPSPVTTLAAGTIYNTAIQLNFTPPSSTNTIDYYECYANEVFKNKVAATGDFVRGLTASTSYSNTVIAVDVFYNKSLVSNSVTQSTNTTSAQPTTGLVSYYKLDANSNDSQGVNNGTDTSVTYVSGKVSNAASYNGTASKTIIGNPANLQLSTGSISCWIKASSAGSSYRSIFGKTLAYNMFLVDGVLMVYNWSSYGTTGNKSTGVNLNDGLWHHVAFVFESSTALNYLYIDGVLKLTFSWAVSSQTDNFCIGSSNSSQYINALIDEGNVYNVKLTQAQLQLIYNNGIGITY